LDGKAFPREKPKKVFPLLCTPRFAQDTALLNLSLRKFLVQVT
jgi:hypothetical protein